MMMMMMLSRITVGGSLGFAVWLGGARVAEPVASSEASLQKIIKLMTSDRKLKASLEGSN